MLTLRTRMRPLFSALLLATLVAAIGAPLVPMQHASAEQIDVMATEQVYVRSGASTETTIIGELFAGDWVTTTGYEENGFVEVWYGDWVGYVYADYLDYTPAEDVATATDADITWGDAGWMYTFDSVNLRAGAGTGEGILTTLPAGTSIYLTGAYANGFAQVESDYGSGWVHTDYISANEPTVVEEPVVTSQGQQIVNFAMQYQGYPYVWAGNTPSGFDCSGFTQYVIQNVLGYDITHTADLQAGYGSAVAWGDWQPGDLIFFTNTGGSGYYSHVGIYIGNGQMIHAENPSTGVVISSVYSDYYSSHYAASVRLP